jgi:hypothetical protein
VASAHPVRSWINKLAVISFSERSDSLCESSRFVELEYFFDNKLTNGIKKQSNLMIQNQRKLKHVHGDVFIFCNMIENRVEMTIRRTFPIATQMEPQIAMHQLKVTASFLHLSLLLPKPICNRFEKILQKNDEPKPTNINRAYRFHRVFNGAVKLALMVPINSSPNLPKKKTKSEEQFLRL